MFCFESMGRKMATTGGLHSGGGAVTLVSCDCLFDQLVCLSILVTFKFEGLFSLALDHAGDMGQGKDCKVGCAQDSTHHR